MSTKDDIREHYERRARELATADDAIAQQRLETHAVSGRLYDAQATCGLDGAKKASAGCGNPTARAELKPGEVVLDLGAGAGLDVLIAARAVGPTGHVYGVDMTDAMLALAERNRAEAKLTNVTFLKGDIEAVPLATGSVDVVISNCTVNLAGDKACVIREAHRVLRPGGRVAVADIVVLEPVDAATRQNMETRLKCRNGALSEREYRDLLGRAGFHDVSIEVTRRYDEEGAFVAALVRAVR